MLPPESHHVGGIVMTAEIVAMNKAAVALAADSAVTVDKEKGEKIYNTVNKLFALSKYRPVGIMVNGNAELMGVPWESIIKTYRAELKDRGFPTLPDYAEDFMKYVEESPEFFTVEDQEEYVYNSIGVYFTGLRQEFTERVDSVIEERGSIDTKEAQRILGQVLVEHHDNWAKVEDLNTFKGQKKKILDKYGRLINRVEKEVFQDFPLSRQDHRLLRAISAFLFTKQVFRSDSTEIIIGGFGDEDVFPWVVSFKVEGVANDRLKYNMSMDKPMHVDKHNPAIIVPFAQKEMVKAFMEGVHPDYGEVVDRYLQDLLNGYPEQVVNKISDDIALDSDHKTALVGRLTRANAEILADFSKKMAGYSQEHHVNPITQAVSILPKDELAAMAESLVNLTSFKRRMSMDAETVGGPIDVAVISKGDGFVWIKRKHYFKGELNPQFFQNYLNDRGKTRGRK